MEQITPYLPEEVSNVWRLWKAGIVRENYARADEPGVVIIFELPDVAAAKQYTDDFPLSKAALLEWMFIALQVPLPMKALFRHDVDVNPPYDRTLKERGGGKMKQAFGVSIPQDLREILAPDRCALIIYDMQNGIVSQIPDGQLIVASCRSLLDAARAAGLRIFFTRHFFLPSRCSGTGQLRRSMIWQRKDDPNKISPMIPYGSHPWQIVSDFAPREHEVIIDKITMSAFESTFLNLAMRDARLQSFIIAGIALEVSIEPAVRHGADLIYIPVLATDACGSRTKDDYDKSLTALGQTGEVVMYSVAEITSSLTPI